MWSLLGELLVTIESFTKFLMASLCHVYGCVILSQAIIFVSCDKVLPCIQLFLMSSMLGIAKFNMTSDNGRHYLI